MSLRRAVLLPLLLLVSPGPALATINIGLCDFGQGSALLDHLIVNHGFDATYTRYSMGSGGSFASVTDFSVQDVWLVPSFGDSRSYSGLYSNTAFQSGSAFSRVLITGMFPDVIHPANEAASMLMMNALRWSAQGGRPGLIVLDDHNYAGYWWLPRSWGVPSLTAFGCAEGVYILQPQHPVLAGLTNALLSNWHCSADDVFEYNDVPGWTTLFRGDGWVLTIVREFCVAPDDCDGDGVPDASDNCPSIPNADQADGDADGVGDACDNCPAVANADQADGDANGIGDACQDTDGDGVIDIADNCPRAANAGQEDADADGVGDACDLCPGHDDRQDADHDGVPDACDNCPAAPNPSQADGNGNGVGDACDDRDGDSVVDADDNCVDVPNPGQENADRDALGDACDACTDTDHDGFGNPGYPGNTCPVDNCPSDYNPDQRDSDGDGVGDACFFCATLHDLPAYSAVVQGSMTAKLSAASYGGGTWFGTEFTGTACVGQARLQGARFYDGDTPGNIVATGATGTVVRFLATHVYFPYTPNQIYGDIVTGGGAVKGIGAIYDLGGVIDTTGTHAALVGCTKAQADARHASEVFASLPPTQVLGDVHVQPDEELHITGGPNEVIEIESLRVDGGTVNPGCDRYDNRGPGTLFVSGDRTVVNVRKRLQLGNCAYVIPDGDVIFNVPGKGPSVRVGRQVVAGAILAPDRTLIVGGAGDDEYTDVHPWVRKLVTTGLTVMDNAQFLCY